MTAVSCEPEQTPELSFGKSIYTMLADEPVTVDVVTNIAPSADLTVELAFTGEAVLDDDYSVSATSVVIPAGQVKGSFTISPLNNFEAGKSVIVSVKALPAGYVAGKNPTATVTIDAKEKIYYSFASATGTVADAYTVKLNLTGAVSGADWVATADMEIPYAVTPALGSALTVADDAFVVKKGENVATLVVNAGEIEGDPQKFVFTVDADKAGERFMAGTNVSTELTVCGAMKLSKLVGTWTFEEVFEDDQLKEWFEIEGDDPELLPLNNSGFSFTITETDGVYSLTTSGTGDFAKYFKEATIDYTEPINMCSEAEQTGTYTSIEKQAWVSEAGCPVDLEYTYFSLSSVYRNFDGNANTVGQGAIALAYDEDMSIILLIKDYDQPPFGEMWWNSDFDSDMFSFASRFVKAE